jgi:hypothetical protein
VDRVVASDGDRDTIDCGANAPDEALVSPGGESTIAGCENVVPVRGPATNRPGPPIGTLRLAPAAARVPAGGIARLRLSWRHPRGWRQLRRIELRIVHAGEAMGAVTIRPRGRRVRAHGAVKLVRRASRIGRKGKTVTARLALRLDRSLAGRRLRVEVEAADVGGARQLERRAGWIRVSD